MLCLQMVHLLCHVFLRYINISLMLAKKAAFQLVCQTQTQSKSLIFVYAGCKEKLCSSRSYNHHHNHHHHTGNIMAPGSRLPGFSICRLKIRKSSIPDPIQTPPPYQIRCSKLSMETRCPKPIIGKHSQPYGCCHPVSDHCRPQPHLCPPRGRQGCRKFQQCLNFITWWGQQPGHLHVGEAVNNDLFSSCTNERF